MTFKKQAFHLLVGSLTLAAAATANAQDMYGAFTWETPNSGSSQEQVQTSAAQNLKYTYSATTVSTDPMSQPWHGQEIVGETTSSGTFKMPAEKTVNASLAKTGQNKVAE